MISAELEKIAASTKLNASVAFFHYLFDLDRTAAHDWLAQHGGDIGKRSTVDLTKLVQNDLQLLCQSDKGL